MNPPQTNKLIAELRALEDEHGECGTAAFLLRLPIEKVHELAPCQCGKGPSQGSSPGPSSTSPPEPPSG